MRWNVYLLTIGLSVVGLTTLSAESLAKQNARVKALLPELRKQADTFRKAFNTPGMAIAVVTRDHVYPLTFGVCDVDKSRPIRTTTLFQYASVSKPITATFAAMLVSQGRLKWDDRISELLPGFKFADEETTKLTTVKDMLDQRSGLPGSSGDVLEALGMSQEFILKQMQYISTEADFRKDWHYTNFGVTIGGVAAASVTGREYPDALQRMFMRPIGMNTGTAEYRQFTRTGNRAALHVIVDGSPLQAFVRPAQSQAPGGGVNGSILDLAAFLQLHLNRGKVKGRQFIRPEALDECYRRYTDLGKGGRLGTDPNDECYYGMGWDITVKPDGTEYINHNGAFSAGARTIVSFRRADQVGLVVLSNGFLTLLPEAMVDVFFQLYDKGEVRPDTLQTFIQRTETDGVKGGVDVLIATLFGLVDASTTINGQPLSAYAGKYRNDYVEDFEIVESFDPESGHNALFFKATSKRVYVKVQIIAASGNLAARTSEGGLIGLDFQNLQGGKFQKLVIPNLGEIKWENLSRVQ